MLIMFKIDNLMFNTSSQLCFGVVLVFFFSVFSFLIFVVVVADGFLFVFVWLVGWFLCFLLLFLGQGRLLPFVFCSFFVFHFVFHFFVRLFLSFYVAF